jgi:hypothetical protein
MDLTLRCEYLLARPVWISPDKCSILENLPNVVHAHCTAKYLGSVPESMPDVKKMLNRSILLAVSLDLISLQVDLLQV